MHFDENKFYRTNAPELACIGTKETLSQWRFKGMGPEYVKPSRNRVLYSGKALNKWLSERVVTPVNSD